jgi:hypothetical protein
VAYPAGEFRTGHLVDKAPVSDLCDEYQILPTQFYQWQKQQIVRHNSWQNSADN